MEALRACGDARDDGMIFLVFPVCGAVSAEVDERK